MEGDVASLGAGIAMGVGALGPGIGIVFWLQEQCNQ